METNLRHLLWPVAFIAVGAFAAIAYVAAHAKGPQVTCIEQRGTWKPSWTTEARGTCEFPK